MTDQANVQQVIQQLGATPAVLEALLSSVPEAVAQTYYEEGRWNVQEVLRHLIHADRTNWPVRIAVILERKEGATLPAFDRAAPDVGAASFAEEIALFKTVREEKLRYVENLDLTVETLELSIPHPELGSVSLRQLLSTWLVHDYAHIAQISRLLAKQHADGVGPWKTFLSILTR